MAPQNEAPIQSPATIATIPISVELVRSCSSVERRVSCSVEGDSSPRAGGGVGGDRVLGGVGAGRLEGGAQGLLLGRGEQLAEVAEDRRLDVGALQQLP